MSVFAFTVSPTDLHFFNVMQYTHYHSSSMQTQHNFCSLLPQNVYKQKIQNGK